MLDASVDLSSEAWCYLGKSTTVIGIPFQPDVTQITYDGAVFTRHAELCFFYGTDNTPLLARGKTFLEGWIPVVRYAWQSATIAYEIEYFAAALEGEDAENTVNHVRLRMRNVGGNPEQGVCVAALRHNGGDYRTGGVSFSEAWSYEMTDSAVIRDGKLVYRFSPGAEREAVPDIPYEHTFVGSQHSLKADSACCLARYRRMLQPGESFAATFAMPRVPVEAAAFRAKVMAVDYDEARKKTVSWWTTLLERGAQFEFPEKCVQDAQRASLVHVLLATRLREGRRIQTDGLPYPDFFLTAAPQEGLIYLLLGCPEYTRNNIIPNAIEQQEPDGMYLDKSLAHGKKIPAAHGHVLYIASMTALVMQDRALADRVFPSLSKAIAFIENSMKTDPYGLLPPAEPYDNEMILGHYTTNNTWALLGLRMAVRLARWMDRTREAEEWTRVEHQYRANILKGIEVSAHPDGYVPPGLHPYLTGPKAREGFSEYQTHCDWENMLLAYPNEVLAPTDPRVRGTVNHVRKGYAEGVMTYRHGQHLHQYITANQIEQYMVMGDGYTALKDFYHILLHAGSTYECFENLVFPWTDRMVAADCPPPHAWASSKLGVLIRDFVLLEYGGECGLDPARRELWLFHCLSPAWTRPGDTIAFRRAPTEFGMVSASLISRATGADISLAAIFHTPPARYRIRLPYFKQLVHCQSDASMETVEGDCIVLSPDATTIRIEWKDKPDAHRGTFGDLLMEYRKADSFEGVDKDGNAIVVPHEPFLLANEKRTAPQPLTFPLVREAFQHEYARRSAECVQKGGKLMKPEPTRWQETRVNKVM